MDIILIDDETDSLFLFRQKFRKWIKQGRIDLKYGSDLAQARSLFETAAGEKARIFLCDLNLPDGNGIEILKMVKARESQSFVFILTGTLDKVQEKACIDAGASAYYVKPVPFELLMTDIEKILEKN